MKILSVVFDYWPSQGGMQAVSMQISERFATFGHDVTVATSKLHGRSTLEKNGVKIEEFEIKGNNVEGIVCTNVERERYQKYLVENDWDVIIFWAGQIWTVDVVWKHLKNIKAKKIFVPTNFSAFKDSRYQDYYELMESRINDFDKVIFIATTGYDYAFCEKHLVNKGKMILIPNGADEREFLNGDNSDIRKELGITKNVTLIYHVGSHTSVKGHAEAIEIFKRANIKNSVLWIVGNVFTEKVKFNSVVAFLRSIKHIFFVGCRSNCISSAWKYNFTLDAIFNRKRIIVKYVDREKTVAGYKTSDIFLFPSNVEGSPIVLFESLICGVPFIATEVGNTKEIVEWTKGGVIIPTVIDERGYSHAIIEPSVPILEKFVNDKEYRLELGRQGKEAVIEKYTWEKIAKEYEELCKELVEKK